MIQIIGAGAIGCLWLAKLQQINEPCHIVSRTPLNTSLLTFTNISGQISTFTISHSQHLLNSTEAEKQSTILVCVKAQQVLNALLAQQHYITEQQPIILMHNGYGCAEEVIKYFPNNPIICATTANASLLKSQLNITESGNGPSYFGPFNSESQGLSSIILPMQKAMNHVFWSENIVEKCWLKLAINAIINPITALEQIKNGVLSAPIYQKVIHELILEVVSIAEAEDIHFKTECIKKTVYDVIKATSKNLSSMNRDVFYQRETEIDFINGYLIKKAQLHGIKVPYLNEFNQKIKALEHPQSIAVDKV